jgi:hypothetical protein
MLALRLHLVEWATKLNGLLRVSSGWSRLGGGNLFLFKLMRLKDMQRAMVF